jgi:YidC/Oxa1 family membrane protein insertase
MPVFSLLNPVFDGAYHAVSGLAAVLVPLFGGTATAAAIVAFTALVRLLLHPLTRAQVRGEQARAALAPAIEKLRKRHKGDPARIQKETAALYKKENVSAVAGCLPALAQMPVLFLMYRLFTSRSVAGHSNRLLDHSLFGIPLGGHMGVAGVGVYTVLLAVIAATATWTVLRARKAIASAVSTTPPPPGSGLIRLLPYGTVVTAAIVPLATGIYLATTTLWSASERAYLARRHAAQS